MACSLVMLISSLRLLHLHCRHHHHLLLLQRRRHRRHWNYHLHPRHQHCCHQQGQLGESSQPSVMGKELGLLKGKGWSAVLSRGLKGNGEKNRWFFSVASRPQLIQSNPTFFNSFLIFF